MWRSLKRMFTRHPRARPRITLEAGLPVSMVVTERVGGVERVGAVVKPVGRQAMGEKAPPPASGSAPSGGRPNGPACRSRVKRTVIEPRRPDLDHVADGVDRCGLAHDADIHALALVFPSSRGWAMVAVADRGPSSSPVMANEDCGERRVRRAGGVGGEINGGPWPIRRPRRPIFMSVVPRSVEGQPSLSCAEKGGWVQAAVSPTGTHRCGREAEAAGAPFAPNGEENWACPLRSSGCW